MFEWLMQMKAGDLVRRVFFVSLIGTVVFVVLISRADAQYASSPTDQILVRIATALERMGQQQPPPPPAVCRCECQ